MSDRITEVAKDLFLVRGTDVNWVLVREGTDLTLVDAGYPGDTDAVEASIRAIGNVPQDLVAVLLTHAHVDHIGAVNALHARYGTPVYLDPIEVRHARRDYLEQAGRGDVVRNLWRPGALGWVRRITKAGATRPVTIAHAEAFPQAGELDLPGRPRPVPMPGHTSGHSAYYLPGAGAVLTGDGLITGHAVSRSHGPQLIPAFFDHGSGDTRAALTALDGLVGDLVLPGHGPVHRGAIAAAAAQARERS